MKILVTGGEGFLGSHVVDALVLRGDDVLVVDHHTSDKVRFPNPGARMLHARFADAVVEQLLHEEKPDVVVHVAAQISVTRSVKDPVYDAQTNIADAVKLHTWAARAGVKRMVFASSGGAIYGDHPVRPTPLVENPEPLSPYGIAKFGFEKYLEGAQALGGPSALSLRFSNFYGPRQQISKKSGEGNVVTLFMSRLLITKEPITIFGNGDASRDYVFIEDAVDAIVRGIDSGHTGPVNIATGGAVSIRELLDTLLEIHGEEHTFLHEPYRPGEVYHSSIDPASGFAALGWKARTSLYEGLKKTYDWYKATFANR